MRCNIGPLVLQLNDLRFLPRYETQDASAIDELDAEEVVRRYLFDASLTTPQGSLGLMPNPVALIREVVKAVRGIARQEATSIFLVEDGEYSMSFAPCQNDLVAVTLNGPSSSLCEWRQAEDRLIVELTRVIHASSAVLQTRARIDLNRLLSKTPSEIAWYASTDA